MQAGQKSGKVWEPQALFLPRFAGKYRGGPPQIPMGQGFSREARATYGAGSPAERACVGRRILSALHGEKSNFLNKVH